MASWERYLVQDAVDDFQSALDSVVPLKHGVEFYTDSRIKEAVQQERRKIFLCYMQKIADISSDKINDVIKELNNEVDQYSTKYMSRNEERRIRSEAFLLKVVEFLHNEYECCLRAYVSTNPYLTLEEYAKIMESERVMVVANFRKWQFGNKDFQVMSEKNLNDRIQKLETELLEEQKGFLTGPAKEEEKRFKEMRQKLIQHLKAQSEEVVENGTQKLELMEKIRRLITEESFQRKEHRRVHGKILEEFSNFVDPSGDLDCLKRFTKELEERRLLDCPIECQQNDEKYIIELFKRSYNSEINGYLEVHGVYKQNWTSEFHELHSQLINKYLHLSTKIMNPTTGRTLPEQSQVWQTLLVKELNDIFVRLKEAIKLEMRKLQLEVNKLVYQRYEEYVKRMEEVLQKNPQGYEQSKLKQLNKASIAELKKGLILDIKKATRESVPSDAHLDALEHQILQYWKTVWSVNEANLAKASENRERQRQKHVQEEEMERARQTYHKTQQRIEPVQWQKQLDPIIFRLSIRHISMATTVNGEFKVIPNASGELFTPSIVGINENENGDLVYGRDAIIQCTSENQQRQHWWITEFLLGGTPLSSEYTVRFRVRGQEVTYDVGLEFLLGFIMRSLKMSAEEQLQGFFTTAVIATPFWFSSTQRLQIKNAAKVAGFSDVYLINEESCAAYALASCQVKTVSTGCLLVLSENYGIVTAVLYTYFMNNNQRQVMMNKVDVCNTFAPKITKKEASIGSDFWSKTRDLGSILFGGTPKENHNVNRYTKIELVRDVCKSLFENRRHGDMWPSGAIFLTSSNGERDSHWYRIFDAVVNEKGYGRTTSFTGVDPCFVGMFGASLLSRRLDRLTDCLMESMYHDIYKCCPESNIKSVAISAEEYRSLPLHSKMHPIELPKQMRRARFFQRNVIDGSDCIIGELTLGLGISYSPQVYPVFEINSEAIINLKEVKCDPIIKGNSEGLQETTSDYTWISPTISEVKRNIIQKLIYLLFQKTETVPLETKTEENGGIKIAKARLEKKCKDMEQGLRNNVYSFKTEVSLELFKKKIEKAKSLLQSSGVTIESLHKELDVLEKACSKYSSSKFQTK